MKIAIVIPAYNCAPQIARVLSEVDALLPSLPNVKNVFVIENQSTDNTLDQSILITKKLKNRQYFEIFQNLANYGLGGTHKVGLRLCKSREMTHMLVLHGDHQASPSDIPMLLASLLETPDASILGSRFANLNKLSGYSPVRTAGNLALNFLYSIVTGKKISDLGSGLNILNVNALDEKIYQKFDNGFTFNMDLLLHLVRAGIPFEYVPIHWSTVDQISNARSFAVGLKTLKKLFNWFRKFETTDLSHFETIKIY